MQSELYPLDVIKALNMLCKITITIVPALVDSRFRYNLTVTA